MPRQTLLDKKWQQLMLLCRKEAELRRERSHPKLLKLLAIEIESLARELGFSDRQIRTREFRAERDGDHIISLIVD